MSRNCLICCVARKKSEDAHTNKQRHRMLGQSLKAWRCNGRGRLLRGNILEFDVRMHEPVVVHMSDPLAHVKLHIPRGRPCARERVRAFRHQVRESSSRRSRPRPLQRQAFRNWPSIRRAYPPSSSSSCYHVNNILP